MLRYLVWNPERKDDAARYKVDPDSEDPALDAKRQHVKARSYRVVYTTSQLRAEPYENSAKLNVLLVQSKGREVSSVMLEILNDSIKNERDLTDE